MENQNNQNAIPFDYSELHAYSGYLMDSAKLLKSASGGAVTAIAEEIIKRGGVVFGASYSPDFKRSEYRCVDNLRHLELLKGSKYCETAKEIIVDDQAKSVFEVLADKLNENRLVLFVGLGCDVGAVKAYCNAQHLNTEKLYLVDILCHGPTLAKVHSDYIDSLEKKFKSRIKNFTVRYKKEGWTPPYIHAEFENGRFFETRFYDSFYGFAFGKLSRSSCYNCQFKGPNHKSDMTCGDYWGLTGSMSGWNKNGVSIMFVKTVRGEELIKMLDGTNFHIEETDPAFALSNNHMYFECTKKDPHYDQFRKDLTEKGLRHAVMHYPTGIKTKMKFVLPQTVTNALVKKLHKVKSWFRN